jgi:ribosomal-protein-alanine N-acetyltransferase
MIFETLKESHAPKLLAFELESREHFESLIAPRDISFYSLLGVQKHIKELQHISGKYFVLIKNDAIIARANIKNIQSNGNAEIGYRVGKHEAGKGIGTTCVKFLVSVAKELGLNFLSAFVICNNPASEKVLLNNGFHLDLCLPNGFEHNGKSFHGFKYLRAVA